MNKDVYQIMNSLKFLLSIILLLQTQTVYAEAGRVVFAYGHVTAESNSGVIRKLNKRSEVESGEIIRTSQRSLVQLRMIDKAFIALRSSSEIKIEQYKLGVNKEEDVGIFQLLKGGFRAVTGIIGKRLRSAYKLKTVNATIGIRGTDYTARICNQDCNQGLGNIASSGNVEDGLYVGVNQGGINLTNQLGTLDLAELQFGYVKDATSAPVALLSAPEFLYFDSSPPDPDVDQASNTEADSESTALVASRASVEPPKSDMNSDQNIQKALQLDPVQNSTEDIEKNNVIDQVAQSSNGNSFSLTSGEITSTRMVVTSYGTPASAGAISKNQSNPFSAASVTNDDLVRFENQHINSSFGNGVYTRGSATTVDLGLDPVTGIAWGRWHAGTAQFQSNSGAVVDMNLNSATNSSNSIHWVYSPDQAQNIALPSNGTASFSLVGNTSPTDNRGHIGILGTSTLNANFSNQTVDTSMAIGINGQVWNGSGSGLPISSNGGFAGNLDTVNVNTGSSVISGTGSAAGFFTNNADGAGLGYSLEAVTGDGPTSVSGTAIFQKN
mgnify:CR=1 FL=1